MAKSVMRPFYSFLYSAAALGAALLIPVVLSGCSRQPDLVGKWSGSDPSFAATLGVGTAAVTYDFHNDGLVEVSEKTDKAASTSSSTASLLVGDATNIHVAGTYTVKDDVLTTTPKSLTLLDSKGQPPSFTPDLKHDPQIYRYKISGATLTLDRLDGSKPLVLTRQKGTE